MENIKKIGGNYKSIGVIEITTLVVLIISIISFFAFGFLIIIDLISPNMEYYLTVHYTLLLKVVDVIKFIFMIQLSLTGLSIFIHACLSVTEKNSEHRILLAGIDYWNFIRGKKLHSIEILEFYTPNIENFADKIGL